MPSTLNESPSPRSINWFPVSLLCGVLLLAVYSLSTLGSFSTIIPSSERQGVPTVLNVVNSGVKRNIPESESINPKTKEDFLLFIWLFPTKIPSEEGRAIPIVKYEKAADHHSGFGFGISRNGAIIHPEIYWKSSSASDGGWYTFPQINYSLKQWQLFALSYRDSRYLGLHYVELGKNNPVGKISKKTIDQNDLKVGEDVRVISLGGHEVTEGIAPTSTEPILIGVSQKGSSFRGKIGPIGIITGSGLTRSIGDLLKNIALNPIEAPPLPASLRLEKFVVNRKGLDS